MLSIILHEVITAAEASFNWAIAPTSVLPITSSKSVVPIVMLPSLNVRVTSEKIIEALLYLPEIILLVKAELFEVTHLSGGSVKNCIANKPQRGDFFKIYAVLYATA